MLPSWALAGPGLPGEASASCLWLWPLDCQPPEGRAASAAAFRFLPLPKAAFRSVNSSWWRGIIFHFPARLEKAGIVLFINLPIDHWAQGRGLRKYSWKEVAWNVFTPCRQCNVLTSRHPGASLCESGGSPRREPQFLRS